MKRLFAALVVAVGMMIGGGAIAAECEGVPSAAEWIERQRDQAQVDVIVDTSDNRIVVELAAFYDTAFGKGKPDADRVIVMGSNAYPNVSVAFFKDGCGVTAMFAPAELVNTIVGTIDGLPLKVPTAETRLRTAS